MRLETAVESHVKQLLELMTFEELRQLSQTVTQQLLVPENRQEAVDMIIRFSESPEQLLRRQKVTRQLLVSYLSSKSNIAIDAGLTKSSLVSSVLSLWQCSEPLKTPEVENPCCHTQDVFVDASHQLVLAFCQCFFGQLNCNSVDENLFWNNARTRLTLRDGDTVVSVVDVSGAPHCARALSVVSGQHGLTLQPNLSPHGAQHTVDKFGRHALAVCGTTVHAGRQLAGIFQLLVALVAAASAANNFQVAVCDLCVVAKPVISGSTAPSLTECGLSVAVIERRYPVEDNPL